MKTTLLAPTLNEIDGVRALLPRIPPALFDQTLAFDGGSAERAGGHGSSVHAQRPKSIPHADREALALIAGDVTVWISPDGKRDPDVLPRLPEKRTHGHDLVIGSRSKDGARSEDDDLVTAEIGVGLKNESRAVRVHTKEIFKLVSAGRDPSFRFAPGRGRPTFAFILSTA